MTNKNETKSNSLSSAFMTNGGGQNAALQYLVDTKSPVTVFLITGVKLDGTINAFDQYTISLYDIHNATQLIYKDKISTIVPKKPFVPSKDKNK